MQSGRQIDRVTCTVWCIPDKDLLLDDGCFKMGWLTWKWNILLITSVIIVNSVCISYTIMI